MTSSLVYVYVTGAAIAVFIFGAITTVLWRYFTRLDHPSVRHANLALSVFFTFVAILVTGDMLYVTKKFDQYVVETQPRDESQEQCERDIIAFLHDWVKAGGGSMDENKIPKCELVGSK